MRAYAALTASTLMLSVPAWAQDPAPPTGSPPVAADPAGDEQADEESIVVVGQRDPNGVVGDIPPENRLGPRDIRAYGAASIAELLDAVAPQTGSARGRGSGPPVVLLNGRRISGFREIRDLPPEAIARMDILPEEVALKYGYSADQRVVNIVLRPRFRSTATRVASEIPTGGGRLSGEGDATRLIINTNGRTSLNVHVEGATALTESERDLVLPPASGPDPRPFRTLAGSRSLARAGGTVNRTILGDVSASIDGQVERSQTRSLLGPALLEPVGALARDGDSLSGHLGAALNGEKHRWRWSLTGAYDLARSSSTTDREDMAVPVAFTDRARSLSRTGTLDLVAIGPLAKLPAGRANLTVRVGGDSREIDSRVRRAGVDSHSALGRDRASAALSVDLPIAKRNGALAAIGNLTVNGNAEAQRLSDFGTLTAIGGGVNWSPLSSVTLIGSWTREDGAPSIQQLGEPVIVTPQTRLFDFVTGQTVFVETVTGGNPALLADRRSVWKLGGTARPFEKADLTLRADYVRTRIDDPQSAFPGPTAAIEAAFPGRFDRDSAGNLVRADLRPVNFASASRDELRWGFTFTKPLQTARPSASTIDRLRQQFRRSATDGTAPPPPPETGEPVRVMVGGPGERPQAGYGPPPADRGGGDLMFRGPGGGGGGFRGGAGGAFGGRGGRLQLNLFHTLLLKDQVTVAEGGPVLDYLSGDVADSGGSRPRHRVELDAGWFNNALGARLSANWQSGSRVTGGPSGDLEFQPLARLNLRLFANLGERLDLVTRHPWLRGSQVRLSVDNLLDEKQKVRDAAGRTPLNYQPDLLDPQGRTVSVSLRKLFLPPPRFLRRTDAQQPPATPASR